MTVTPIPPFDLSVQFQQIGDAINQAALTVLASGRYIGGSTVEQFEREFAAYHGMTECVACNSGTDALYLALRALGIGVGDEVITTPFTFFATAEMISLTGATPVFVDIDATFNLDPNKVAAAITPQTKAIMPVHLFGRSADMGAIGAIAKTHGLAIVEDCPSDGNGMAGSESRQYGASRLLQLLSDKKSGGVRGRWGDDDE
jgi:dTDP-4-amino-4,6-dideoxygalactose transaminase